MGTIAVYDNVKNRAKAAGISINAIEKRAGLSIGSVCKWNTVSPTASSLLKVAQILGCSINDLLIQSDNVTKGKESV